MRIGYICGTTSWGGLEMNQAKNALWMYKRGHEVWAIGLENSKFQQFCTENGIPFLTIQTHKKYYDFKAAKILCRLLKSHRIEHLMLRDVRDMSVSVAAKYWGKSPFKVHYFMEMQLGVSKKNLLHTLRFRLLDTWSCPLHWLEEQVRTKTRMPKHRIVVIPSALDRSPFTRILAPDQAREQLGINSELPLIGLAGRFDPQKGQVLLLEALSKIYTTNIGVVFLGEPTANEGEAYHQHMLELIERHQLGNRIFVRPFRKDIEVFYKAIDAFVMASKAETVGMVTIEALASGTPVIGSNAGGTPEILKNGKVGYLFEPLNADSLASAITAFLQHSTAWSKEELQKSVAHFDHHRVMELVEKRLQAT